VVWRAPRGSGYETESQEQHQKTSAEVREADAEATKLQSHWRVCVGDIERPSVDAEGLGAVKRPSTLTLRLGEVLENFSLLGKLVWHSIVLKNC